MSNLVGRTLGPYKLEAPLGKGGMAMVFRAFQTSVKRYVAIKVMAPEIASEPGFVERFSREAEVIAQLEHPHILPVIDYGEADGLHYIVMRFMDGGSLDDIIRTKQLSFEDISRYLTQIASALDYAHRRGVIHRDLKPNNVLLDSDENVYLTDFGIARLASSERKLTATGSVMGTPAYMAPEQAMGRPVDARSDLYALGIMLYEMITRQLPFSADTPAALIFQHVYEQPKPASTFRSDLPSSVLAVLDKAMAKSPDTRYQTGGDMARGFAEAVGIRTSTPRTAQQPMSDTSMDERTMAIRQTPSPTAPRATAAAGNERTLVDNAPMNYQQGRSSTPSASAATQYNDSTSAAPQQKRSSTGMIIGIIVILLLAGAGGAFAFITNNNNNATATWVAISAVQTLDHTATLGAQTANAILAATGEAQTNATGTQQAIIISSYTPTPTNTATSTETPTPSSTPTFTDTPDAAATANALAATQTQAAISAQSTSVSSTLAAFQTREAETNLTATAQSEATLAARATNTVQAATFEAGRQATLAAQQTSVALTAFAPTPIPPTWTPIPPTKVAVSGALDGLLSDDPATIITTLRSAGVLTTRNRLNKVGVPAARATGSYSGNSTESRVFYSSPITATRFDNFVLSTTIGLNTSDDGVTRTYCGVFYHGEATATSTLRDWTPKDLSAFAFNRAGDFGVYVARDSTIESNPVLESSSTAINGGKDATNRLTVVQINGQLTVFVNGVQVVDTQNPAFTNGQLGFFFFKGVTGDTEICSVADTQLWRILG